MAALPRPAPVPAGPRGGPRPAPAKDLEASADDAEDLKGENSYGYGYYGGYPGLHYGYYPYSYGFYGHGE